MSLLLSAPSPTADMVSNWWGRLARFQYVRNFSAVIGVPQKKHRGIKCQHNRRPFKRRLWPFDIPEIVILFDGGIFVLVHAYKRVCVSSRMNANTKASHKNHLFNYKEIYYVGRCPVDKTLLSLLFKCIASKNLTKFIYPLLTYLLTY